MKLREHDCPRRVTVQKVCRLARDEKEVRQTLDEIWKQPEEAQETMGRLREKNEDLYKFENMLESRETTN